jgi:predicted ferric reductase
VTLPSAAVLGPSAYWYLTRGTGIVSLLLLSAVMVIGVLGPLRVSLAPLWPRFALDALHRDLSLLSVAVIAVHVIVSVLDGFAPIALIDGIIPFHSPYRPLWLGIGALAFDLMLAVILTSVIRQRLGYRAWRWVHWLAYASWPLAVAHGLGTGTDANQLWALAITFGCVACVAVAVIARVIRTEGITEAWRTTAIALAVAIPVGLAVFALKGPLSPNWARRAGTPAQLLPHSSTVAAVTVR